MSEKVRIEEAEADYWRSHQIRTALQAQRAAQERNEAQDRLGAACALIVVLAAAVTVLVATLAVKSLGIWP